jgi:hypothetical protein
MKPVSCIIGLLPRGTILMDIGTGKTQVTTVGGLTSILAVWLLNTYVVHPPMPDYIDSAITGLICILCTYLTPHDVSVKNLLPSSKGPSA